MSGTANLDKAGRVMIPRVFRERLKLAEGVELIVRIEDGELRMTTRAEALKRAQRALATLKPAGKSVVDEFLEDRRKEAERE